MEGNYFMYQGEKGGLGTCFCAILENSGRCANSWGRWWYDCG